MPKDFIASNELREAFLARQDADCQDYDLSANNTSRNCKYCHGAKVDCYGQDCICTWGEGAVVEFDKKGEMKSNEKAS